jgi:tellurite resistance protein TehA-like permease
MIYSPNGMMDGMGAMMWGMGLFWLLVVVVLILGALALAKFVFFRGSHKG